MEVFVFCPTEIAHMTKSVVCIVLAALTACGMVYFLSGRKEPTFQNHNMAQWLGILKTDTDSAGDPLRIGQIIYNNKSRIGAVEVPLSYELVKKYDFCERQGKFDLVINGRYVSTTCWRATNGNCSLAFDQTELNPGTNQIRIWFMINNPSDIDHFLHATGPITRLVSSNAFRSR